VSAIATLGILASSYTVLVASVDFSLATALPNWLVCNRSGPAMHSDASGRITWGPNNVLLNSAALGTQSVTTLRARYLLSFKGTGSVTLSGAYSGSLTGTGANNRVNLAFIATAGTLTLTVSGSVTSARLSLATYETSMRAVDDVDTTSTPYYGARIDYSPGSRPGLLIEPAQTNLASAQFSDVAWTQWDDAFVDAVSDGTLSVDGVTLATKLSSIKLGPSQRLLYSNQTIPIGTNTVSAMVKRGSFDYAAIYLDDAGSNSAGANFGIGGTVDANALAMAATGPSAPTINRAIVSYVGNDWYRLTLEFYTPIVLTRMFVGFGNFSRNNFSLVSGVTENGLLAFSALGRRSLAMGDSAFLHVAMPEIKTSGMLTSPINVGGSRSADTVSAGAYSSNPAVIQVRNLATGVRSRKIINPWSNVSSEANEVIESAAIYKMDIAPSDLNGRLTVDSAY
jgi:hypothetical protein